MTYNIYPASSQLMTKEDKRKRKSKYPWHELKLGQSFTVPDNEITYASLFTLARRTGARHDRVYRVYHHVADKLLEVGYVGDIKQPIATADAGMPGLNVTPANAVLDEIRKMEE